MSCCQWQYLFRDCFCMLDKVETGQMHMQGALPLHKLLSKFRFNVKRRKVLCNVLCELEYERPY